jgi:hypothetical protein
VIPQTSPRGESIRSPYLDNPSERWRLVILQLFTLLLLEDFPWSEDHLLPKKQNKFLESSMNINGDDDTSIKIIAQRSYPFLGPRDGLSVRRSPRSFSYSIRYGWRMGGSDHIYLSVRMRGGSGTKTIRYGWVFTDGVFEIPIPSVTMTDGVLPEPIRIRHPSTDRTAVLHSRQKN